MENKRLILALLLSMAVWYLWLYFFKEPVPPTKPDISETTQEDQIKRKASKTMARPISQTDIKVYASKVKNEEKIKLDTDIYSVQFSNKGAVINSLKYIERDVELVVNREKLNAKGFFDFPLYLSEEEFLRGSPIDDALWNYKKQNQNTISFNTTISINKRPVRLEKTYTFYKDKYFFRVEYKISNISNKEVVFPNGYIIISPSDFLGPDMDFDNRYNNINSIYYLNGDFEKGDKGGGFFTKSGSYNTEAGDISWVGLMSRYFLLIMISEKTSGTGVVFDSRENTGYRTGIYLPEDRIQPNSEIIKSFKVYAGEKNKDRLAAVDENLKDAADISKWIEPIRDFLLWCLIKINLLVGNYGWALVIFSILTKIALLPLTQKSTVSMKKMQELAPKINELKEKYKDKPDVLNKETMKLYKANKVNPLSGCLPLLLQMPFFFALWSALINSIDLWQAPFILWINDLSLPDTIYKLHGFNINILPIIMTAISFVQQRLTTTSSAGSQQKMMMIMPLIFIFIFWNMPSGLVLYWTLQNALQILHQVYINKSTKEE